VPPGDLGDPMKTTLTLATAAALGSALLVAAPAQAAPPTATQTVPLSCDNDSSGVAQVDERGLPSRSAWIDGHGVAARAFARTESGTLHLSDGATATYSVDEAPGVDPGRSGIRLVLDPVSLSNTTACHLPDEPFTFTLTLSAEDVAFVGIDPSYVGTDAEVEGHGVTTVYLGTAQLAARS
jgi:hypothetical protein